MKKYKLIKELPFENSPKIGYISKSHILREDSVHYYNGNWFYPDKYPEFWQEVVEKDYEILEIKGKYGYISSYIEKLDHNLKDQTIFKVKRLSDGEIFTVGDKTSGGTIKEFGLFTINSNKTKFISIVYAHDLKNSNYPDFENVQHLKQPLFITEDGIEIYEGDSPWFILSNTHCEGFKLPVNQFNNITKQCNRDGFYKYFSTKEKAEEYIIMNKPCLSLNDVAKVYVSAGFEITKSNKNMKYVKQQLQLRELIKTKLKKAL